MYVNPAIWHIASLEIDYVSMQSRTMIQENIDAAFLIMALEGEP